MKRLARLQCALALMALPLAAGAAAPTATLSPAALAGAKASLAKLDLSRLTLLKRLGFEDGSMCVSPVPIAEASIDMHRSLMVHDVATLSAKDFSLRRTLQKLSNDVLASVPGTTPESIYRQMWDSQNAAPGVTAANPHCSDNNGKLGAYPFNNCPRPEGNEANGPDADIATRINGYQAIALVNRLDLTSSGWQNCGEHRIIYGKSGGGFAKNLIIFEAVLPNPKPGCRSACRGVVDFWTGLSADPDPVSRATKLETYFFTGLPGYRPVVHTNHYSSGVSSTYGGSGSGQIRTDQFLGGPWTLKEFKTLLSCSGGACDYDILPINVKGNPYGVLWSRDVANGGAPTPPPANAFATPIAGLPTLATNLQSEVLAQVTLTLLGHPDLNKITYEVSTDKNAAESQSQAPSIDHYLNQYNASADAGFRASLDAAAAAVGLTGTQIVNRAAAQSCAGCHQPASFGLLAANSIKPGVSWPDSLNFVHVDIATRAFGLADGFDVAQFAGNASGFNISPALLTSFLPARRTDLAAKANADICDCVPKLGLFSADKLPKLKAVLDGSNLRLKAALDSSRKRLPAVPQKVADAARLNAQSLAVLAKGEAERAAQLRKIGITYEPPTLKAEAVTLSPVRLPKENLLKAKQAMLEQIVTAEPPRKTVSGSFRTH